MAAAPAGGPGAALGIGRGDAGCARRSVRGASVGGAGRGRSIASRTTSFGRWWRATGCTIRGWDRRHPCRPPRAGGPRNGAARSSWITQAMMCGVHGYRTGARRRRGHWPRRRLAAYALSAPAVYRCST